MQHRTIIIGVSVLHRILYGNNTHRIPVAYYRTFSIPQSIITMENEDGTCVRFPLN